MKKYSFALIALIGIVVLGCVLLLVGRSRDTPASLAATAAPTAAPSATPTAVPTEAPTPTPAPTATPTEAPTATPTQAPTEAPTATPTVAPTEEPAPTPKLQIDPNAGALITPTPAPTMPGIAIPGWGSITLPAGVTEAQTSLQNPESNEGWYYLTFEMRLPTVDEATGEEGYEVLFTTGLIPPGQYCNKVTLTRPLEPGEYKAVIHVQPYTIENLTPTNNADMETVLIVP